MHPSTLSNGHSSGHWKGKNYVTENRRVASMGPETPQRLRWDYSKLRQFYLCYQLK